MGLQTRPPLSHVLYSSCVSRLKNSTRDSDPAALNTVVSVFCGLLIIKILMLVYLLLRWDLDWEQMEQRTRSVMVAQDRNLPESRGEEKC